MIGYILYDIYKCLRYGPEKPTVKRYDPSKDPVANPYYGLKLLTIQDEVDRAERGVEPPRTLPYKDGKSVVPKYKHDWWWCRFGRKPELQRVDNSYYPFTLVEKNCGKLEVPFSYSFPQHEVTRDRTWFCFKRENRWNWLK